MALRIYGSCNVDPILEFIKDNVKTEEIVEQLDQREVMDAISIKDFIEHHGKDAVIEYFTEEDLRKSLNLENLETT